MAQEQDEKQIGVFGKSWTAQDGTKEPRKREMAKPAVLAMVINYTR